MRRSAAFPERTSQVLRSCPVVAAFPVLSLLPVATKNICQHRRRPFLVQLSFSCRVFCLPRASSSDIHGPATRPVGHALFVVGRLRDRSLSVDEAAQHFHAGTGGHAAACRIMSTLDGFRHRVGCVAVSDRTNGRWPWENGGDRSLLLALVRATQHARRNPSSITIASTAIAREGGCGRVRAPRFRLNQ
ncbi:hypothetical protein Q31a_53330 [Aureliella helgolandensis]|uniref:Uncharacterized protein n=1 Tax=Aureliella helgolandensis TaxID=2527968 RepID=A0A518GED1_9BACT|nr:hypothetical protein Q31a_53330 [Aureliella helgolandensis]